MFQGFSQATNDFLWGIRFNNERPWFEAHKQTYLDHVQTPMRQLAQEVYEKFSARHEALPLMVRVSRIYRDARRLYGRGPYKDHLWLSLRHENEAWTSRPVFYFEIMPEGPTKAISGFPCVWLGTAGQNGRCCGLRSIPPDTPMAWGFMRRSPPPWPGSVRTWMSIPRP